MNKNFNTTQNQSTIKLVTFLCKLGDGAKCEELSRVGETRSMDSGPCALLSLAGVAALVLSHGESDVTLLVPVETVGHKVARGTSFVRSS